MAFVQGFVRRHWPRLPKVVTEKIWALQSINEAQNVHASWQHTSPKRRSPSRPHLQFVIGTARTSPLPSQAEGEHGPNFESSMLILMAPMWGSAPSARGTFRRMRRTKSSGLTLAQVSLCQRHRPTKGNDSSRLTP